MTARALTAAALWAAATAIASPVLAQTPQTPAPPADWMTAPRDWSAALRQDAQALHDLIIENHPGVHDRQNPAFRAKVDAGLAEALARAETTTDVGGWWWGLRAFTASFDDGHVALGMVDQSSGFSLRWPGFLTAYRGEDQVVATRDEADPGAPPLGARLIDCDGVPADRLAEQRIGAFRGRWFLRAQRVALGDWQFLDGQNPWTSEPSACRFETPAGVQTYALAWRPADDADLTARRARLTPRGPGEFGLQTFEDGGVWIATPSFNGDPNGSAHAPLTALVANMNGRQAELRTAPYVVLDLRGNGGGSSHWSQQMAQALWGDAWLAAHQEPPIEAIEWRASEANLATLQSYVDRWTAAGESAERIGWAQAVVDGMTAARAAGQPYFRDPASPPTPAPTEAVQLMKGPVYVLTDPGCASACLDGVDLWKAAGAIQIGQETSADTVYMDVRGDRLPSGLARVAIPMKVWRGRARGNNEPQRPAHAYDGDWNDEAALRAWVKTLS